MEHLPFFESNRGKNLDLTTRIQILTEDPMEWEKYYPDLFQGKKRSPLLEKEFRALKAERQTKELTPDNSHSIQRMLESTGIPTIIVAPFLMPMVAKKENLQIYIHPSAVTAMGEMRKFGETIVINGCEFGFIWHEIEQEECAILTHAQIVQPCESAKKARA